MNLDLWFALTLLNNSRKIHLYNAYEDKEKLCYDIINNKNNLVTEKEREKLLKSFNKKKIDDIIYTINKENIKYTIYGDKNYPKEFYNVDEPPFILFYKGNLEEIYSKKNIAIVGARNCTQYGKEVSRYIINELGDYNINVISGGARGIDTICHEQCIRNKLFTTAILGCGIDIIYPKENNKLFENLINNGVLISEFTPGTQPFSYNFPRRNRLISGLSEIVIVIEGGEKSGTLTTVSHALSQGKDVMAVPGPIYSNLSKGCNKLIRDGAYPFTEIEDLFQLLKITKKEKLFDNVERKYKNSELKNKIYNILNNEPLHIDSIVKIANIDIKVLYELLFELQFEEKILCINGNFYVKSI